MATQYAPRPAPAQSSSGGGDRSPRRPNNNGRKGQGHYTEGCRIGKPIRPYIPNAGKCFHCGAKRDKNHNRNWRKCPEACQFCHTRDHQGVECERCPNPGEHYGTIQRLFEAQKEAGVLKQSASAPRRPSSGQDLGKDSQMTPNGQDEIIDLRRMVQDLQQRSDAQQERSDAQQVEIQALHARVQELEARPRAGPEDIEWDSDEVDENLKRSR
ncbi:hypothetical protein IWX90DRAFT_474303 [Phyllosticta citrichinensis]|uniref:CCHC-type domain-containing protein n=1 Tax=Phyllosticta citrichinensis TaxID=1130410 RepID=A0ABR1Y6V9_9PEZI